jgi:hypothetical protein
VTLSTKQQQQQQIRVYNKILLLCSSDSSNNNMFSLKENVSAAFLAEKAREIEKVLSGPDVDLWKLRELALSEGGLVNGMSFQSCHVSICVFLFFMTLTT